MKFPNKNPDTVKNNSLFAGIEPEQLSISVHQNDFMEVNEGDIIFQSGDKSDYLYLLVEGEVKIKVTNAPNFHVVYRKDKNEFFGEREIFEKVNRHSSAVANISSLLYHISQNNLKTLIQKYPQIKINLSESMQPGAEDETAGSSSILSRIESFALGDYPSKKVIVPPEKEEVIQANNAEEVPPHVEQPPETIPEEPLSAGEEMENVPPIEGVKAAEELVENLDWDFETAGESLTADDTPQEIKTLPIESEEESAPIELEETAESISPEEIFQDSHQAVQAEEYPFKDEDIPKDENPIQQEEIKLGSASLQSDIYLQIMGDLLGSIASSTTMDELQINALDAAIKLSNADAGFLYTVDMSGGYLARILPADSTPSKIRIDSFAAGYAAYNCEFLFIENVNEDAKYNSKLDSSNIENIKQSVCIPIRRNAIETIFVIELLKKSAFKEEELKKLVLLQKTAEGAAKRLEKSDETAFREKMKSLGEFANFLIKDVRTPLLSIKYYAEHIKRKDIDAEIKQIVEMLIAQSNSVIDLLQATFDYTIYKLTLHARSQSFNNMVNELLGVLAEYVESRNAKLYKKLTSDVKVNVDKRVFYQACYQIAKKACDAMPGGGNIYVQSKLESGAVLLELRDEGKGIPKEIIDDIFNPFFTFGKENATGLGLAISKKIIEEHGGSLTAESVEGNGTVFMISLPVVD
jgi:signal transduction histidine kinase